MASHLKDFYVNQPTPGNGLRTVIRRAPRPESNFYFLSKDISEDKRLSWAARGLLVFLLGKPDHWQVSPAALVNETRNHARGTGRDGVYAILKELREVGYLQVCGVRDATGSFAGNDYLVSEVPCEEIVPREDKPDTAQPRPANPPQVSTEEKQGLKKKEKARPITFNLATAAFDNISEQQLQVWHSAYPKADVQQEIKRAGAWLLANPKNAKDNYARFLTNWINRSYGSGPAAGARGQQAPGQPTAYQATQERRANFMAAMTTQGEPDDRTPDFDFRDNARTIDAETRLVD